MKCGKHWQVMGDELHETIQSIMVPHILYVNDFVYWIRQLKLVSSQNHREPHIDYIPSKSKKPICTYRIRRDNFRSQVLRNPWQNFKNTSLNITLNWQEELNTRHPHKITCSKRWLMNPMGRFWVPSSTTHLHMEGFSVRWVGNRLLLIKLILQFIFCFLDCFVYGLLHVSPCL